ncbi:MAG TPA: PAS domain S-box protein, partial [Candidatus Hydrogenedentes bacterium]|nr:PAS domain S-box protein [Candidatus Hydrogenedentota bacterium]
MTRLAALLVLLAAAGWAYAGADDAPSARGSLSLPAALAATSAALLAVAIGMGIAFLRMRRHEREAREAVAERDRAMHAMRVGEERYQDLFNNINSGVAVLDAKQDGEDFVLEDMNAAGERLEGRFREDLIGRSVAEIDLTGIGGPLMAVCREVWQSGKSVRRQFSSRKSGHAGRWFDCFVYKLSTGEIVCVYEDITPRKRAEDENRLLATAVQHAGESILITAPDSTIEYVNPAFEKISGLSREEVLGNTPRILKSGRHGAPFYRQMWETLLRGETWRGRLTNKRKDGSLYEKEVTISPVFNAAGEVEHYVSISRDLTQEMELAAKLRHAQKMEAIGTLAGGIAH